MMKTSRAEQHVCSEPCAERTLERFSFSSHRLERFPDHQYTETFISKTTDMRTDDLMILRMRVIFQADDKHVIQVFCIISESGIK